MPNAIHIEGLRELRASCKGGAAELVTELKAINKDAAEIVARRAAQIAPTDKGRQDNHPTGLLRDSIRTGNQAARGVVMAGGATVPWAGPIHFGWSTRPNAAKGWRGGPIAPQPFLYDALDQKHDEVVRHYEEQVLAFNTRHFPEVT